MCVENKMLSADIALSAARNIQDVVNTFGASLDPGKVVKEGGTGFAKIIAAVRYEFKQRDPVIKATSNDNWLKVSVFCEIGGLAI